MKLCLQFVSLTILFSTLVSCQLPTGLDVAATTTTPTPMPDIQAASLPPLTVLAVGLDAPTWESHKSSVANAEGPAALDHTYAQIKTRKKVIAITFDDGPHHTNTPRLLDMLKERGIRSTFYVVGNMVRKGNNPKILKRMVDEGHEIGNHTVTHGTLSRMTDEQVRSELKRAHDQIVAATNIPPKTMRPPGGSLRLDQRKKILKEFGYPTILWSCDPQDWRRPGSSVVAQRLIDGAYPGGILLVHDLHKPTIDAMPHALDTLLAKGYTFVTITELISMDESVR